MTMMVDEGDGTPALNCYLQPLRHALIKPYARMLLRSPSIALPLHFSRGHDIPRSLLNDISSPNPNHTPDPSFDAN